MQVPGLLSRLDGVMALTCSMLHAFPDFSDTLNICLAISATPLTRPTYPYPLHQQRHRDDILPDTIPIHIQLEPKKDDRLKIHLASSYSD